MPSHTKLSQPTIFLYALCLSIRVEDTTGKPLPNIRVSNGPISDLDQKNPHALPEFSGLSDQSGVTTPLWISDELRRWKVLTPGYRIV